MSSINSASTHLTISSTYDLLNPDGINCLFNGGNFILNRPNGLSNLSRVNFRAFKGELLPFTNIELPELKADLVLMSNGLKSVELDGEDTIDIPGVEKYSNDKHNIILSINKAWTYSENEDSQVLANISEIIEIMNTKLKEYLKPVGFYMNVLSLDEELNNNFFSFDYAFIPWSNGSVGVVPQVSPTAQYIPYVSTDKIKFFDGNWTPSDKLDYHEVGEGKAILCRHRIDETHDTIKYYAIDGDYLVPLGSEIQTLKNSNQGINSTAQYTAQRFFTISGTTYDVLIYRTATELLCEVHKFVINGLSSTITTCSFSDFQTAYYPASDCDGLYFISIFNNNSILYSGHVFFVFIYRMGDHFTLLTLESNLDLSTMTVSSQTIYQPFAGDFPATTFNDFNLEFYNSGLHCQLIETSNHESLDNANIENLDCGQLVLSSGVISAGQNYHVRENMKSQNIYVRTLENGIYSYVPLSSISDLTNGSVFKNSEPNTSEVVALTGATKYYTLPSPDDKLEFILGGPVFSLHGATGSLVELTNENLSFKNADGLINVFGINVKGSAVDTSNNTKYLDPRNNDYLCTRRHNYLYIDPLNPLHYDPTDGKIKGSLYIPQVEFQSDYVMNMNLRIYSDPFMFELYTDRDFDIEGNDWNVDVNNTTMKYYASNSGIFEMLEQLILLKYNYNDITLRVSGFPNGDGVVFNMNDESQIRFKSMTANSTTNHLTVQLFGDNEILDPEIMSKLYGKVSLEVDWEM